ncbi:MAG: hypothetical protein ACPLRN_04315, partial [Microgenomates group bacterium]
NFKSAKTYFKKYLKIYKNYQSMVIFIDVKPKISWKRRKNKYWQRIKEAGIIDKDEIKKRFKKYKKIIFDLYPLWLKYFKIIPFQKIIIKNSYKTKKVFLEETEKKIKNFLKLQKIFINPT